MDSHFLVHYVFRVSIERRGVIISQYEGGGSSSWDVVIKGEFKVSDSTLFISEFNAIENLELSLSLLILVVCSSFCDGDIGTSFSEYVSNKDTNSFNSKCDGII